MEKSKILPNLVEISTNLPEDAMQAGEVDLRKTFYQIKPRPEWGGKDNWFSSVARATGLPKSRIRSLYKDRRCRLWGTEAARIQDALSKASQAQNQKINNLVERNGETRVAQGEIDRIKGELKSEIIEDLRSLLLELSGSGAGDSVRRAGETSNRH